MAEDSVKVVSEFQTEVVTDVQQKHFSGPDLSDHVKNQSSLVTFPETIDFSDLKVDEKMVHDWIQKEGYEEAARKAAYKTSHPDYPLAAGRIVMFLLKKKAPKTLRGYVDEMKLDMRNRFLEAMKKKRVPKGIEGVVRNEENKDMPPSRLNRYTLAFMEANLEVLEKALAEADEKKRDYNFDYFAVKTLERGYLLRNLSGVTIETPQLMLMRVACQLHHTLNDPKSLERCLETFEYTSLGLFTHASPTLFNAGQQKPQLASCFLLSIEDNLEHIFQTLYNSAMISKHSGGLGIDATRIRHSKIGTNGDSSGIVPMLQVYNSTVRYVDQCFLPGTTVYTLQGPKPIEEVGPGDQVVTRDGSFQTVKRILQHDYDSKEQIFNLTTLDSVNVVGIHPFLSFTTKKGMTNDQIYEGLERGYVEPDWTDVQDLTENSFVAFPIPTYVKDIEGLTLDDCKMYGFMISNGEVSKVGVYTCPNTEFVRYYLGMRAIHFKGGRKLSWSGGEKFPFTRAMLENFHAPFLHLPEEKTRTIVESMTQGRENFLSKSRNVIQSLKYMLLRLGVAAKVNKTGLTIPKNQNHIHIEYEGILWVKVESLKRNTKGYSGLVYDLEIEGVSQDDHKNEFHRNYLTSTGLPHNGGKRKGSATIYLEPWHPDIFDFLLLKKNTGKEENRARDLTYALWVPDIFMRRVWQKKNWTLMCPNKAKGLSELTGKEFEEAYEFFEAVLPDSDKKVVPAMDLFNLILDSDLENGQPFWLFSDTCNRKSNHRELGKIRCSNLCVSPETMILTDKGQLPIGTLEGQKVKVWNGTEWSEVTVKKTGVNQKLLKVTLSDGQSTECTEYHKFILDDPTNKHTIKTAERIEAKELKPGMKLFKFEFPSATGIQTKQTQVIEVKDCGRISDTFCFNEEKNHAGVFNGNLLGNCTEVVEYTGGDEIASCNLGSITLNRMVRNGKFDFKLLGKITRILVRNINNVIDDNYNPAKEIQKSNQMHRPLGIGVQGLADTFALLDLPFTSAEAKALNKKIFACIYYHALQESLQMAKEVGPYPTFKKSPLAKGLFQFDLWEEEAQTRELPEGLEYKYDKTVIHPSEFDAEGTWDSLRAEIVEFGVRNSLLIALMPTASTAQILGNTEGCEPSSSNMYTRRVLSGEFIVTNRHLCRDLEELGLWNDEVIEEIIAHEGEIDSLPAKFGHKLETEAQRERLKFLVEKYKTAYQLLQTELATMEADRGKYVCQSSSHNVFLKNPNKAKLAKYLFHAWIIGMKTAMYYARMLSESSASQFTVDSTKAKKNVRLGKKPKESPDALVEPIGPVKFEKRSKSDTDLAGSEPVEPKLKASVSLQVPKRKPQCTDEICIMCQ